MILSDKDIKDLIFSSIEIHFYLRGRHSPMADPHGQATFYHYRLIKKIQISKSLLILYLSLPWLAGKEGHFGCHRISCSIC